MDIGRVGIHGGSYGGYAAFRAMFEFPEFYKVGVSGAGEGALHPQYPDYHQAAFHGKPVYEDGSHLRPDPTARPVNWENADGTLQTDRLQGKLLIQLGELDENVFPATTLQLVDALIKADKDFDMVYYPNRPHGFRSSYSVRRVWDYFVENLMGVEPPEFHIESLE
jgi:dipeptidyl aminopeptidase/acylaminoacyl peptidase